MNFDSQVGRNALIKILEKYGNNICLEKNGYLKPLMAESEAAGNPFNFTLYILAPEIAYEYRVVNVQIVNGSKLVISFYTMATQQIEQYIVDGSEGIGGYEMKLMEIFNLGLFKAALDSLVMQIETKRTYRMDTIEQMIVPGQARIAVLQNGDQINVGWIRIEDETVVYYTGKGLRELWKPNMTSEEHRLAALWKAKPEVELIREGLIAKSKISDFIRILW